MTRVSLITLLGCILVLVNLAPLSAAAQNSRRKTEFGPTCICQFGYGGKACVPAASCSAEGGRCAKPCDMPPDNQAVH